jgi:hypothetical protein
MPPSRGLHDRATPAGSARWVGSSVAQAGVRGADEAQVRSCRGCAIAPDEQGSACCMPAVRRDGQRRRPWTTTTRNNGGVAGKQPWAGCCCCSGSWSWPARPSTGPRQLGRRRRTLCLAPHPRRRRLRRASRIVRAAEHAATTTEAHHSGDLVGANPVDRGKPGSKLHLVCDGGGPPLAAAVTAANVPAVLTPAGRRRCRPEKVHAGKGYDARRCHAYLRRRGITPRIARPGIESSQRLGCQCWRVERSLSWLSCFRRLQVRWDRGSGRFFAFVLLACAQVCFNRLPRRG